MLSERYGHLFRDLNIPSTAAENIVKIIEDETRNEMVKMLRDRLTEEQEQIFRLIARQKSIGLQAKLEIDQNLNIRKYKRNIAVSGLITAGLVEEYEGEGRKKMYRITKDLGLDLAKKLITEQEQSR